MPILKGNFKNEQKNFSLYGSVLTTQRLAFLCCQCDASNTE